MTRDGKVTELPGIGAHARGEDRGAARHGHDPRGREAAGPHPGRPHRHHAPARPRAQARAQALRRARHRLARGAARGGRGPAAARRARLRREVRGVRPRGLRGRRRRGAARRACCSTRRWTSASGIVEALRAHPASERVELAGSARRLADSVKDLDIIATASDPPALLTAFAELDVIESSSSPGENAARARTHTGVSVDLRVVEPDQFGNLLQHFTGSKAHNMALREAAVRRGLHVSEYGMLDDATGETHALRDRGGGLRAARPAVDPARAAREPRRARAGRRRRCPCSSSRATSRATCTCTRRSATAAPTPRRWRCARASSASSTSRSPTTRRRTASATTSRPTRCARRSRRSARSTSAWRASACSSAPRRTSAPTARPTTTTSCWRELDWVVGSVHTSFAIGSDAMTERMIAAIEHPLIDAIGHPTGRKIAVARALRGRRRARSSRRRRAPGRCSRSTPRPTAATSTTSTRATRPPRACGSSSTPTPTVPNTMIHTRWGIATARRAWLTQGRRRQHAALGAVRGAAQARAAEQARQQLVAHDGVDRGAAVGRDAPPARARRSRARGRRARRAARSPGRRPTSRASRARASGSAA